jgi:hypothetical protein
MASNKQMTKWLFRHTNTVHQSFQDVADAANNDEMVKFISALIGCSAFVDDITSEISDRQEAAAAITTEIAPTATDNAHQASDDGDAVAAVVQSAAITTDEGTTEAITTEIARTATDHSDQASDDGDTVAAVVVPSATITPTEEGTTEAASAEGEPSGLKETHAEEAADAQEADANADAETDNDHQAAVLQLLKQYAIQGIELANRAQLLSAHPISTLPPRMCLNTTQRGWKTITIVYPVSGRTVIRYISPDGILFYSKRKADMYVEELAKAGGDPIAALDRFLRRYKAWQEEQKQAAKRSAGGLQEVEPKVKRTRRKEPTTTGPRIKSPPPLLTPAVAGAAVAVQPQATSGGPLLAAGLPASISQSSAESEDGLPRLSPLFGWPALEDSELDDLFAKKLSQSSRDGKVDDWDKFMESLA